MLPKPLTIEVVPAYNMNLFEYAVLGGCSERVYERVARKNRSFQLWHLGQSSKADPKNNGSWMSW